ncbi:MAG: DUF4173 domain-containing protein, partial [Bacteroidia bacterium]|nr:DUF4173 domain-containing protein [Bacteroidia bacterium]NNJ54848.1 DUF4173 domain-containing protein [Bacteroidia bacterium]
MIIGLHTTVPLRNVLYALPNAAPNFAKATGGFLKSLRGRKRTKMGIPFGKIMRIVFLPLFIILLFLALYSMGSNYFAEVVENLGEVFSKIINKIAKYIDIEVVAVGFLGLLFAVMHSLGFTSSMFSDSDIEKSDKLERIRASFKKRFRILDLKYEYKSGVFLFVVLNMMLLMLLILEIKNIWINFTWQGEFLKEFVHEGTYVLIVSILVSMAITLHYFRKNLNFYRNNSWLKRLAYVWVGLNSVLILSVFVRNAYYIQYFGLAYRRIGVVVFLLLCLIGLVTLIMKIRSVKTTYFIVRINAIAVYITIVLTCAINWDSYIARYNFAHYKTAFVHLPFMSDLSDKALPYLQLSDEQIEEIESKQTEKIPFARKGYFKEVDYKNKIASRVEEFTAEYENRHWLEIVWAEQRAYQKLK